MKFNLFSRRQGLIFRSLIYTVFLVAAFACGQGKQVKELILLHTNDSHGSVLAVDSTGGLAERATFIRQVREKYPYVLLLDAGDINAGQPVSNIADAKPDILAYNAMGYDAVTAGNHEFDKPLDILLQQMRWADFPFVISNIFKEGKPLGKPWIIKDYDGIKVGILGLTTVNTKSLSVNAGELEFENEAEAARRAVKALKAEGADIIIGLVHLGFTEATPDFITSRKLAEQVEGIDILVDGHSHSYIEKPEKVKDTWIITANQSGKYVGEGKLKIQKGEIIDFEWQPVLIRGFAPDTVVERMLQPFVKAAEQSLKTVVGVAKGDFVLYKDGVNLGRQEENALGNLIADAMKTVTAEELKLPADFALINSGGIREGIPAGQVTREQLLTTLPFSNVLEIVALKGTDVKQLFDFLATVPSGNGTFAQVSEDVKVTYDRKAGKVADLKIGGKPVVDSVTYYMATCDYIVAGKDGYDAGLKNAVLQENTSRLISDVVADYLLKKGTVIPRVDGRIRFTE